MFIITAISNQNGIGLNGKLPWKNESDMKFFRFITKNVNDPNKQNAIVMGRRTFESINSKPLPNRKNVVITKNEYDDLDSYITLDLALDALESDVSIENIFVIGGEQLYREAIHNYKCKGIYLNRIHTDIKCDTFFPVIPLDKYKVVGSVQIGHDVTSEYLYSINH
jgi:dihydrofolate reductase/thymidylate synthase